MTVPATPVKGIARRLDADEIGRLLPHRHPLLLLDRVLELDPPRRAVGIKNVAIAEPWFAGHFPGRALLPGVLLTECLAQLAGVLVAAEQAVRPEPADPAVPAAHPDVHPAAHPYGDSNGHSDGASVAGAYAGDGIGVLAEIKRFRFRHPVLPGDRVRLEVTLTSQLGRVREFACLASVAGNRTAHGTLVIVA
ncbi:MAG TPA: 3-hydroxyacyl-ACP dehydratase FabZ family protein [Streptosporangiaceae bacterium]